MSRPHDGHWTFLPFGNPLRMIFPKGSYLSPELCLLLSSFEQTLAENLKKLNPEDVADIWSLSWLRDALDFLSETHNNIKSLITDLELPVSDWEEEWIDVYLDSTVKLLDICIALSSELSRLDQGQILLQYVLHDLDTSSNSSEELKRVQSTLSDWMQQIDSRSPRLEEGCVILQGLAGTLYSAKVKNSAKGKVLMQALYGVKVVTVFVCSVFVSALSGSAKPLISLDVPDKFIWAEAFNDLQADVFKEIISQASREKVMRLKELGDVENCVKRLCSLSDSIGKEDEILEETSSACNNGTARWQESVTQLTECAERLSIGLDCLSKQVGDFFQIVLMGRDALLCNLRISDEVTMQDNNSVAERS